METNSFFWHIITLLCKKARRFCRRVIFQYKLIEYFPPFLPIPLGPVRRSLGEGGERIKARDDDCSL